jgi:hypothetical protein
MAERRYPAILPAVIKIKPGEEPVMREHVEEAVRTLKQVFDLNTKACFLSVRWIFYAIIE